MVFRGPDGVQVQGYERLEPPLPDAIPDFERFTRPFNIMQMVRDRDAAYDFFTRVLGFETFYKGKPYVSDEPVYMPLGIPKNLTTEVRYRAGIVHPRPGEFGRMEMIEIMDLEGRDHAERCAAPNLGILAVRFPIENTRDALYSIVERGGTIEFFASGVEIEPYGRLRMFNVKTPDGANVHFYEVLGEE
jgi:catechol 2,3-dioxygenase-like lactoylglutathione lyase family enzyme